MFSVVIPLYNKAAYIGKAVQSVIDQSFDEFELIIVNDGSTDNGPEILKQFEDSRIIIVNQNNKGVSAARNNGVEASKYGYIAFLDADDWWAPDYLLESYGLIQKYPDAGIWASKYYKVKNGDNIEAKIGLDNGFQKGYIEYFRVYARTMWMPLTSSSFIVSKRVFKEYGGFNQELKFGEDFHLWSRIALNYNIAFINKPMVYYNQDLGANERAVGGFKIFMPENHFIFHLDDLEIEESWNPDLKTLLDKLRLSALFRYRLNGKYNQEMLAVLRHVDFSNQSLSWKLKYKAPLWLVRLWFTFRKAGSNIKKKFKGRKKFSS